MTREDGWKSRFMIELKWLPTYRKFNIGRVQSVEVKMEECLLACPG